MNGIKLEHLRSFAAVIEAGSFSTAARRQNLTQPAVSLQIRQLEERLGTKLVERTGRSVRATDAGERLLAQIAPVEEALAAAVEAVAPYQKDVAGRISIGTGATACTYLLPPVLRQLRRKFPKLDIIVKTGNAPDILDAVVQNKLDAALVTMPAPGRALAVLHTIDDEQMAVFPRRRFAIPVRVTAQALSRLPIILYEPGGHTRRVIDAWFQREDVAVQPVMELGNVEAIKEMVGAGLGCAILPRLAVSGRRGNGLIVKPLSPRLFRKLGLVLRRDKRLSRALRQVVSALSAT